MECPYCHKSMEKGYLNSPRDNLKWIEAEKNKGALMSHFQSGIKLTDWYENQVETYYCRKCQKMIIDVADKIK